MFKLECPTEVREVIKGHEVDALREGRQNKGGMKRKLKMMGQEGLNEVGVESRVKGEYEEG